MPKIKMNLDEVGNGFTPIPAGTYEAYVYEVEAKTFNSGNSGYKVTFNIADGPYKGRKIFDNLVITPKAYWKLGQFWRAMTGDTGEVEMDTDKFPEFVGTRVELEVKIEKQTYNNEERENNVVKGMNFLGGKVPVDSGDDLTAMLENREPAAAGAEDSPF